MGRNTPITLLPVEVVELAPKLRDLTTDNEIDGSEVPDLRENQTNPMVEINRMAHREIKIRIGYGMPSGLKPYDDLNNPAIFMIRKKGDAEPLLRSRTKTKAVYFDLGGEYSLNLSNEKKQKSQTSVFIKSETDYIKGQQGNHTWYFILKIPGGGFIERTNDHQFEAPENGYLEEIKLGFEKDNTRWKSRAEKEFFVKFLNGNYGRVNLDMWSKGINGFGFDSYINPSGSRNLEYNPKIRIHQK